MMRTVAAWLVLGIALTLATEAHAVRVGLVVDAESVTIGEATSEILVVAEGDPLGKRPRTGALRFGLREATGTPARATPWFVRVAVENSRRKADMMREALASSLRTPLKVERAGSGYAVLAGPFDHEARARALMNELDEVGMDGAVLLKPEGADPSNGGARLVVLTSSWDVVPVPSESVRLLSTTSDLLRVDGKPYRGALEVSVNARGKLTVVNEVPLEEYLRGVVPAELGPAQYPAVEALKAQAVAARTYSFMKSAHAADGFDRCALPHCQVYAGASAEHALSDRAISESAGLILTFEGAPAHAYFSSTCGGHTEAIENVFGEESLPYLRGVPCYPEKVEFLRIAGRQLAVDFTRVDGRTAHGVVARLLAVGVVSEDEAKAGVFSKRVRAEEAIGWLRRAAPLAGRTPDARALGAINVDTALGFVRTMSAALRLTGAEPLIETQDLAAASRFREMQGLSGEDLRAAIIGLKAGLLPEGLEPGWAATRLSRGNVLEFIEAWLRAEGQLDPAPVRFLGSRGSAIEVLAGAERQVKSVAAGVTLLSGRAGAPKRLRDAIELKLGDRLRLHGDASATVRCIELDEDPDGASLDRLSAYSWWRRRVEMADMARRAEAAGLPGLRDIRVTRFSPAGRVVGLELADGLGNVKLLERFAVRQFLGLPDSRCDVQIERDASGRLAAVLATGRGWGHGVGLCQVGAFGMALQGKGFGEILEHYYPGTRLEPVAAADR